MSYLDSTTTSTNTTPVGVGLAWDMAGLGPRINMGGAEALRYAAIAAAVAVAVVVVYMVARKRKG